MREEEEAPRLGVGDQIQVVVVARHGQRVRQLPGRQEAEGERRGLEHASLFLQEQTEASKMHDSTSTQVKTYILKANSMPKLVFLLSSVTFSTSRIFWGERQKHVVTCICNFMSGSTFKIQHSRWIIFTKQTPLATSRTGPKLCGCGRFLQARASEPLQWVNLELLSTHRAIKLSSPFGKKTE